MTKIFTCVSALPGSGAKFFATNFAHYAKQLYPDMKVALIDFDFEYPYLAEKLALHDSIHSIDNLTDKIDGGFMDEDLFLENMITLRDGVELLKGTRFAGNFSVVTQEHVDVILDLLAQVYDFVFIATGSKFHPGLSQAVFRSDAVFVVTQNNYASFREIDGICRMVNHCKSDKTPVQLVLNKYVEASDVVFSAQVAEHGLKEIELVPYSEEAFDHSDLSKSLIASKLFKQRKQIQDVFEGFVEKYVVHSTI